MLTFIRVESSWLPLLAFHHNSMHDIRRQPYHRPRTQPRVSAHGECERIGRPERARAGCGEVHLPREAEAAKCLPVPPFPRALDSERCLLLRP